MKRHLLILCAGAVALGLSLSRPAPAQDSYELKIAHFVTPLHPMSKYLENWAAGLSERSGGRLRFTILPGAQMGPPPKYYDLARTGQTDISWFLHGATPGRFPLTELSHLPYLVGSAEIGSKLLNDPQLRSDYLDAEHKGVKVLLLFTHQPGQIHSRETPIRSVADTAGLRLRFASSTIRDFVAALGATPVGVPPTEMAEGLQKGTIDGVFIDYGGAGIAFKLGPHVRYTTETYSYVTSFGLAMNPDSFADLPGELQTLIDESVQGIEAEVGRAWDQIDQPGKDIMLQAGTEAITLGAEQDAEFKTIGRQVAEARIEQLESEGLPAREVYQRMQTLAAEHAKTSKNFWAESP